MEQERLFEVWKDGVPKMGTNSESCIYDKDTIKAMKMAGYTIIDRRKKKHKQPSEKAYMG